MKIYLNPGRESWPELIQRPLPDNNKVRTKVEEIVGAVRERGDDALREFTRRFDGADLLEFRVQSADLEEAERILSEPLKEAIRVATSNISRFHTRQIPAEETLETMPGVRCWREYRPLESVGLYIPGGSAPLFSTVLMLAIPAVLAGVDHIILCTPPGSDGSIHPAILYAASLSGVHAIFKVGGAQAIAAMAIGTDSIPKVDKIFGPGNHYVTEAKLAAQRIGVAIDLPAGPSEVLIIADKSASPDFIAADLLSQAEHGGDSQVVLLTTDKSLLDSVPHSLDTQLDSLPRKEIASVALSNSLLIYFEKIEECIAFSNAYAPEHLILATDDPFNLSNSVRNAGSVFLGHYSPESVGDYASGTNHTLPTAGWARSYSGVSLDSFIKKITFQHLSPEGLSLLGPHVQIMAEAEGLQGHAEAVTIRLKS